MNLDKIHSLLEESVVAKDTSSNNTIQSEIMAESNDNEEPQEKYTKIDSTKPLFACVNAFDYNHECVYVVCAACKILQDPPSKRQKRTSTRKRQTKSTAQFSYQDPQLKESLSNEPKHCDHNSLDPFSDVAYYETKYLNSIMLDTTKSFPFKCSSCGARIIAGDVPPLKSAFQVNPVVIENEGGNEQSM